MTDTTPNVGSAERVVSALAGGGLVAYGLKQGGLAGVIAMVAGGGMLYRGTTGHCHAYDALGVDTARAGDGKTKSPFSHSVFSGRIHVTKSVTVNKSAAELYEFWRNFENLPIFMKHLESVTKTGDNTSHWKAKAPLGTSVEWDAEVTSDVANEKIGWKSLEGACRITIANRADTFWNREIAADNGVDACLVENATRSPYPAAALRDGSGHEQLEANAERTACRALHIALSERLVMRAFE